MKIVLAGRAIKALGDRTPATRKAFHKQLAFLEQNLLHPSLHSKKYQEASNLWQARVTEVGDSTL